MPIRSIHPRFTLAFGIVALTLTLAPATRAQTPPLPGTVQPGQIERQFQAPPQPRAQPGEVQIPPSDQTPPANAQEIRFTLNDLFVDGAQAYPEQALRPLYAGYLKREVSLADIYAIANSLTAKYRNDGYILSQVVVPAQAVQQGVVKLQAVEGYVNEIKLEGEVAGRRQLVEAYAEKIKRTRPLTAAALERYLLLMNDLPGMLARATLAPAAGQPGASDLLVRISQRKFSGGAQIDNRGSDALGPWRLNADLDLNSVFGLQERTTLRAISTGNRELALWSVAHEEQLGSEGGKLGLSFTATDAQPELGAGLPRNLETSSRSGALTFTYPLTRSRSTNLYLRGALTAHNGKTDIGSIRNSEDRIRAIRLGATFDMADRYRGINLLDFEVGQGLNALGARHSGAGDPPLSRAGGNSDFTKMTVYAARLQSLAQRWSLLTAANAQYAFSDLLAPELFAFGGEQFGRGYDPSELVGDSGAALKLELRYTGAPGDDVLTGYTAYGFYDVGSVRRRTPINEAASESAAAAGLGLRFSLGRHVSGFAELAKPLTRDVAAEGNRDARGYVGLVVRF